MHSTEDRLDQGGTAAHARVSAEPASLGLVAVEAEHSPGAGEGAAVPDGRAGLPDGHGPQAHARARARATSAPPSRETFRTSRLLDFASERELTAQIGHQPAQWPQVAVKELVDNGLDACEEAGVAPRIEVDVDRGGIRVADNGPGIAADVVADVLDFSVRVSSREAYVGPTRGAQGTNLPQIYLTARGPGAISPGWKHATFAASGERRRRSYAGGPCSWSSGRA